MTLRPERQRARMSKITNYGLTRSGTGCFIAVPIGQQWASKGKGMQGETDSWTDLLAPEQKPDSYYTVQVS